MSVLLILFSGLAAFGQVNLALGKVATQSSEMGKPYKPTDGLASKAVDGNTDGRWDQGSVTHTACNIGNNGACQGSQDPFWLVDLGAVYQIDQIVIWNRVEVPERLDKFRIMVKGEFGDWQDFTQLTKGENGKLQEFKGLATYLPSRSRVFPGTKKGRYVRVQLLGSGVILSLAEVQVFGMDVRRPGTVGDSCAGKTLKPGDSMNFKLFALDAVVTVLRGKQEICYLKIVIDSDFKRRWKVNLRDVNEYSATVNYIRFKSEALQNGYLVKWQMTPDEDLYTFTTADGKREVASLTAKLDDPKRTPR